MPGSRSESPEDKNLDLQVERLVRAGCAMGNIRAEEASGAKNDRGGLLELLDLVVEGDTLVVTHIDRLSRGLTYGLQVIEGLHQAGVEFRSLAEDFDTATPPASSSSRWCSPSASGGGTRSGSARSRARRRRGPRGVSLADGPSLTEQQREYIRVERSKGVSQRELAKLLEVSRWTIQQVDG
ncbi:Probable DNA-invertase y4cG [Geodia barretti]|uniref:Probable DNA-invertase y4cG n=1 Tax=Geodia barretti TaxID=519541 RepID=A0AA35XB45_GEOBA|nr:Probable DNA-invertase y4cG [Geodia barretti]